MARLPQGVRKRKDGTLEKRITINGHRYSVYASNTKDLLSKESDLKKKIESGIYTDNRNITVDEFFKDWLNRKRNHVKSNTLKTYRINFERHISPQLGRRKVQALERREIINLLNSIAENVSIYTSNYVLKIIRMMLNDACIDDVISKNPANGIKAIKDKKSEKAVDTIHRALTLQEQKAFMDEVESDYYYEFIAFLLCSGLRTGELSALKWRDIDTKENQIHIRRTMTFDESGVMIIGDSTKSDAGMRDIPLTPILKNILNRWKNKIGKTSLDGTIFVAVNGGYVYSGAVNRAIANALDRLKEKGVDIPIFAAHCLRDTYATRFLEETGDLQTLKTLLGHSSLAMTSDLYAHVLPNTKQEKAEKVNFDIAL